MDFIPARFRNAKNIFDMYLSTCKDKVYSGFDAKDIISKCDDLLTIHWAYSKCNTIVDYERTCVLAYRLIVGGQLHTDLFEGLKSSTSVQGEEFFLQYAKKDMIGNSIQSSSIEDFIGSLRQCVDGVKSVNNTPIVKKLVAMYSYLLVHGYLKKIGFEVNELEYTQLERKALYASYSDKKDMWLCVFDTTLFVCEKLLEFRQTGEISVFFHNSSTYTKWIIAADKISALSSFTSNLEAHGTNYFQFVAELDNLIEQGDAYAKYTSINDGVESKIIRARLANLICIKNTEVTRRAAQKERAAPFGALIYGGSSVAKSLFSRVLFHYYGQLHDLDTDDHYRYVRSPSDQYWSNFDSSKWCIQLDDIAFQAAGVGTDVDPTLKEVINVVNNVPYVPPQADLADKGKTPVIAKLVIATTNTIHLNSQAYFSCPLAVQRRLPFVVTVKPKECYLQDNRQFIKPDSLPETFDEYPDFWDITVSRIEPETHGGNKKDANAKWIAKIVEEQVFSNIDEFLAYFGKRTLEHIKNQDQSASCENAMRKITVCKNCYFKTELCKCDPPPDINSLFPDLPSDLPGSEDESKSDPGWFGDFFKKETQIVDLEKRIEDLKTKGEVQNRVIDFATGFCHDFNTKESISICILLLWWYVIPWNPISTFWFFIDSFIFINTYSPWFVIFLIICQRNGWLDSIISYVHNLFITGTFTTFVKDCFHGSIYILVNWKRYLWLQKKAAKYRFWRAFIITYIFPYYEPTKQMSLLGKWHSAKKQSPKLKSLIKLIAGLSVFYASFKMYETYKNAPKKIEPKEEKSEAFEQQGGVFSAEDQLPKEELRNVWYNSQVELSRFDVPLPSNSITGASSDELRNIFGANCLRLRIKPIFEDKATVKGSEICCVVVGQNYCLTNNHAFDTSAVSYEINVISMSTAEGISSNVFMKLKASNIIRNAEKDICMFRILGSPYRNILHFWDKGGKELNSNRAIYLTRNKSGKLDKTDIHNIMYTPNFTVEGLLTSLPIYMGQVQKDEITKEGDCGSLAIAQTPQGAVLIGIHVMGYGTTIGTIAITKSDIDALMTRHQEVWPSIVIQGGGSPVFKCEDKTHILGPSHHKSTARYISQGTAKYYGSFVGMRSKPKTKIQSTPLQFKMMQHFDRKVDHGAPVMVGWQPWRNNLMDMLEPTELHDPDILQTCMFSYSDDILSGLNKESPNWKKELVFLSKEAAINGLDGVKYIDRLNANTSMGFPWNTTKNNYILPAPTEKHPDGITFVQEVLDNIDKVIERYRSGQRWYPVFMGHLKDEARPFKKIRDASTRMFTGTPADWTIAMRSRFLSFVRLFQKNKFIFEAGPGTACQSTEWGEIYTYITFHGVDRMVAGDFGKYDKSLRAAFILAAFHIIIIIHRAAGFTEEQILELRGFATDTAYPLVNIFGELWEFFMSNSSGHSLTVIINSLDNSLYMRYAYYVLNPDKECHTFKQNVRLFTYGDDNIMGISKKCPWFNHTSIQRVLGEIGIKYTMADKEAKSQEYIHIRDCTFLKRSWRFDVDIKQWFCPLDETSIFKSLTVWLPSKSISPEAQMVAIIFSANSEYFFYGRERFEKEHEFFKSILAEHPYCCYANNGLPNWDELVTRFNHLSGIDTPCLEGLGRSEDSITGHKTE